MNLIRRFKFSLGGIILGLVVSVVTISQTRPVYQSVSEILILRSKQETPYKVLEESRNRWIWLRDGLSLQQNILDENFAKKVFADPKLKESELGHLLKLREKVKIEYTGADEFLFRIKVADSSKELALTLNQHAFERIEQLFLEEPVQVFEKSLEAFKAAYQASQRDEEYQRKLTELTALHAWEQVQRESAFQIILRPMLLEQPIWPKKGAMLVIGFVFGLLIGLILDYFCMSCKKSTNV